MVDEKRKVENIKLEDIERELANLKSTYGHRLDSLSQRAAAASNKLTTHAMVSTHDPFNMAADCSELATLAGKIEQTANVIRWMTTPAKS